MEEVLQLNNEIVKSRCRLLQGADTCRFLTNSREGWVCGYVRPGIRALLEVKPGMKAQGKPCEAAQLLVSAWREDGQDA